MAKKYLIGVDLGTSSTKAALYTVEGQLAAEAALEVPLYYPGPGVVEQDQNDFYSTAAGCVRACLEQSGVDPRQVAALAFDSQMAGIGMIDENFQPAGRFDSWLDMRCQPYIAAIERDFGELVTRATGCPPTCAHGPKILWWKEEQPQVYRRIAKFLTPAGYVAGRLAGIKAEQAFMDATFIHFSGLSDTQNGRWSDELVGRLGVDPDKLPRIVEPWSLIGETSPVGAAEFGLAPGTPIAAGCGDTAANALGAGVTRPGMLFDVAGTAAVLASCTREFVADVANRALLTMRSVIPGLWHPLAYVAGGGLALRWFRDQFYRPQRGQPQDLPEDLYAELLATAEAVVPGSDGLFFSPHLGGRICPATPEMRGAWLGFSWGHTQAHFLRAVLESVAYEYAYYLGILRALVPGWQPLEARVVGGGARSPVWNQIKADVLNVPYQPLRGREFGCWGSALIAGKAAGLFSDLAEAAARLALPAGKPHLPDPGARQIYQARVSQYIAWQRTLAQAFTAVL
jgi:xylulokinase